MGEDTSDKTENKGLSGQSSLVSNISVQTKQIKITGNIRQIE